MNTVIKLSEEHRDLFYNFVNFEIQYRNLHQDPLWKNIDYIREDRDIFAYVIDDKIQMCMAVDNISTMPWVIHNTMITNHRLHGFQSIKIFKKFYTFILDYYEKQGIWSHWYARSERLDASIKDKNKFSEYNNISHYGIMLAKVVDEKYHIADRAYIKKNTLTGITLYDKVLGWNPVPYDVTIRQLSLKQNYMSTDLKDAITYG
jgi:hypothetical protein